MQTITITRVGRQVCPRSFHKVFRHVSAPQCTSSHMAYRLTSGARLCSMLCGLVSIAGQALHKGCAAPSWCPAQAASPASISSRTQVTQYFQQQAVTRPF